VALAKQGRSSEAIAHYGKALAANPEFGEAHTNLAIALSGQGRLDEAKPHFEKALALHPDSAEALTNLGAVLLWKGETEAAIANLEKAAAINPESAEAHNYLGAALCAKGRACEALAHWRKALRLKQNDVALPNQTAWVLATNPDASVRNGPEAIELAERAVRTSGGKEPRILATLGAAYAESGRFPEALRIARKALDLAAEQNNKSLAGTLDAMIGLYKSRTALRAPPQRAAMPFQERQPGS